jgi:MFS family permease
MGFILSLSAVIYGYSLKEITSVPISALVSRYSISMNSSAAQSILIGILPLGSLFGDFITHFMLRKTQRLFGIYVFTLLNLAAVILININSFGTLIAGRFLEGICVGYYTLLAPIYLREIAPKEIRRRLGLFFSFGKIVGILLAVAMELLFPVISDPIFYRIVLSFTAALSALQAILVFLFCPPTPTELIERGQE